MTQDYTDNCFNTTNDALDEMQQTEYNFEALKNNFAGDDAPGVSDSLFSEIPFMMWGDTDHEILRMCHPDYGSSINSSEEDWPGLMFGDENQKIWIYRNDTIDGWVIDIEIDDCLLGIQSNSGYYSSTGQRGSWSVGFGQHNHKWLECQDSGPTRDQIFDSDGIVQNIPTVNFSKGNAWGVLDAEPTGDTNDLWRVFTDNDYFTSNADGTGEISDWRPQATVGTLQYLNIV